MLDWREREHEDVDLAAIEHQPSIDALKDADYINTGPYLA
jgi:hypothetical protein